MPTVSVIIPNYNHARYLRQRIDTVLKQTFTDIEVILMDDASTDQSVSIIQAYSADSRVRTMINPTNSGSTFKQWNRGIGSATGKMIWIAESDDYADLNFLNRFVLLLDARPNVGIAYCASNVVDSEGNQLRTTHRDFHGLGDRERWMRDFVADGPELCKSVFAQQNVVANASAAVFRRSLYLQVGGADESMSISGDWLCWAKMLMRADLAYLAEPLNYYRTHPDSVRRSTSPTTALIENTRVLQTISANLPVNPKIVRAQRRWLIDAWINSLLWRRDFRSVGREPIIITILRTPPVLLLHAAARAAVRATRIIRIGRARYWLSHLKGSSR